MEVLNKLVYDDPQGVVYYNIINSDGKEWLINNDNIRTAFYLYQPTAVKGKLLKKAFPFIRFFPFVYHKLNIHRRKVVMDSSVMKILKFHFGNNFSVSFFGGTPCVHQKAVLQISANLLIEAYCKVATSDDVGELFDRECENLKYLDIHGVCNIPKVIFRCDVNDLKLFCQSSVKKANVKTIVSLQEIHWEFLRELNEKTRQYFDFEETDYYLMLKQFSENIKKSEFCFSEDIVRAIKLVCKKSKMLRLEYAFYHGDFTPWNMAIEGGELKVFDFEYAKRSYPPFLDAVHFFLQTEFFVKKIYDVKEIFDNYQISLVWKKMGREKSLYCMIEYLLEIINLYLSRTDEESVQEKKRQKIRMELLQKVMHEYDELFEV